MQQEQLERIKQYLCPPGSGVYTVHTAKEKKDDLHQKLYGMIDEAATKKWEETLPKTIASSRPCLLGVCSDNGGGILRGANWGPLFIREQLYKKKAQDFNDLGDIRVIPHLLHDKYLNQQTLDNCRKALYNDESSRLCVSPLSITEDLLVELYESSPQLKVMALGGDHSVSYPLVKAYLQAKKKQNIKTAIIHFDAHTDLLATRLGIDLCFGSWAYHILPYLDSPSLLKQYGIRSSGQEKEYWEKKYGIKQYWNHDFKKRGAEEILEDTIKDLKKENVEELYISFDIDCIDSSYCSATGTPEDNGLEPHETILIMKGLAQEFRISGADLVEVAPFVHQQGNKLIKEPDSTLMVAGQLGQIMLEALSK